MSKPTQDLHNLVAKLAKRRLKFRNLHLSLIANDLIRELNSDQLEIAIATVKLNKPLFLHEAENPERRILHQAVINAVEEIVKEKSAKAGNIALPASHDRIRPSNPKGAP